MTNEIIKRYDKIIFDLFIVMLVILIYLLLSQYWFMLILFGLLVTGSYVATKKEIKAIKESIDNDITS